MSYKEKLVKIKNFVFDVDGVFTDGSIIVDNQGNEFRVFSTRDGIAVKLATDKGYNFCVISGGKNEGVRKRLNRLGVKNVFLGVDDKILEKGILDSPAIIKLILFIEKKYKVIIEEDGMNIDSFSSINQIEKLIKSKIG